MPEDEPKKVDRRTLSELKIGVVGAKKKDPNDKVIPVTAYVTKRHVDAIGGIVVARQIALDAVLGADKVNKDNS